MAVDRVFRYEVAWVQKGGDAIGAPGRATYVYALSGGGFYSADFQSVLFCERFDYRHRVLFVSNGQHVDNWRFPRAK
jgi:hypothetical protein